MFNFNHNFMKLRVYVLLMLFFLLIPAIVVRAVVTPNNLKGKILLQVESKGEAWYVNPQDGKRYYLANGEDAFKIMKTLGVGISNKDLEKIKTDANFRKKFVGKILLQVESHGEAYYISFDGRYNYLKDGAAAYAVMRKLGLGISNKDLAKIAVKEDNTSNTTGQTNNSSTNNLTVAVRIPKNVYRVSESLAGSDYYLKYVGVPFQGLILYGTSREGLAKTPYSSTRGTIQTGDFDNPETIPYMKVSLYSVKYDGTPNIFDCDGMYKYTISVYDCASVNKILGTSNCGEGDTPSQSRNEEIVAKVPPLKTATKNISVVCEEGTSSCCSNEAYNCSKDKDCLSGYGCQSGKCIKK